MSKVVVLHVPVEVTYTPYYVDAGQVHHVAVLLPKNTMDAFYNEGWRTIQQYYDGFVKKLSNGFVTSRSHDQHDLPCLLEPGAPVPFLLKGKTVDTTGTLLRDPPKRVYVSSYGAVEMEPRPGFEEFTLCVFQPPVTVYYNAAWFDSWRLGYQGALKVCTPSRSTEQEEGDKNLHQ